MALSTFAIGLILGMTPLGIWARLTVISKTSPGFSIGGEYSGAAIFVAEYSPDRKRGFMGSWLDFGSIAGFVMRRVFCCPYLNHYGWLHSMG